MNLNLFNAVRSLYPQAVRSVDDIVYDINGTEVAYDLAAAEAKLVELQAAETAAKTAALAKLTALGLTPADLTALGL